MFKTWREQDAFVIGLIAGIVAGAFLGAFTWWLLNRDWGSEKNEPTVVAVDSGQLQAMRRVQKYIQDHPDVTLDELDRLTPEWLAELYPDIQ